MTSLDMTSESNSLSILWIAPAKARRGRPTKQPSKVEQRIESIILGLLSGTWGNGYRMEEILATTGYTAAQCRPVMQRLMATGVVRRTGNTRGARYQAVGL